MQPADSSYFELAAVLLGLQLLFAMEALRAAYNLPLAGELPISLEAYAAALKHFKDWALGQVEACKKFQTALNGHNIFAVQAVGTLCEGSGRPDLLALLEVKGLAAMLVALPTNYIHIQIYKFLGEAHQEVALRSPPSQDDSYWLQFQAKRLVVMRGRLHFMKKYPARMQHRITTMPAADLETIAGFLHGLQAIPVKEPFFAQKLQSTALGPVALQNAAVLKTPAEAALVPPQLQQPAVTPPQPPSLEIPPSWRDTPPPVRNAGGIPLMFLECIYETPRIFNVRSDSPNAEDWLTPVRKPPRPPRPISKGAVQTQFPKKEKK